jgi:hypothetical protein
MAVPATIRVFLGFYGGIINKYQQTYHFMWDYVGTTSKNGNLSNEEWITYYVGGIYEAHQAARIQ